MEESDKSTEKADEDEDDDDQDQGEDEVNDEADKQQELDDKVNHNRDEQDDEEDEREEKQNSTSAKEHEDEQELDNMLDDKQMERPEEMGETTPKGDRFRKEDHEQTHLQKEDLEHHPEHVKKKAKVSIPVPIATPVRSGMARKSTVGLDEAERTPPTTSPESSEKTQSSRKLKPQSSYEDADLRMPKKKTKSLSEEVTASGDDGRPLLRKSQRLSCKPKSSEVLCQEGDSKSKKKHRPLEMEALH